jgi:hypothetical protein
MGDPSANAADFWFYFRQNRGAVVGMWVFLGLVSWWQFLPS